VTRPTDYQTPIIDSSSQIYNWDVKHNYPEQSAIFQDVMFSVLNITYHGVCVSPECEIENESRMQYLIFCPLLPLEKFIIIQSLHYGFTEEEMRGEVELIGKRKDQAKSFYASIYNQYLRNKSFRYYFLLGDGEKIKNSVVDFAIVQCLSAKECDSLKKLCVLKSTFREDLPTKFGSYISRIGTAPLKDGITKEAVDNLNIGLFVNLKKKK